MSCVTYNPIRTYVQYNDLVFSSADTIESASYRVSTKGDSHEYSFGHGSYDPEKAEYLFMTEGSLSLTINMNYRLFRKEDRKHIGDYMKLNLVKSGRIWAIQDDKLLWAYARPTEFSEVYEYFKDHYSMDVDFRLREGYWHIADLKNVFLVPYDNCNFTDDYDFREINECEDCCTSCPKDHEERCASCLDDCGNLCEQDSACSMSKEELNNFLKCGKSYKIVYNCNRANQLFGEKTLGTKICKKDICESVIAGKFYSDSVLPTTLVTVTLTGKWQDPIININGTKKMIKGDYDGRLTMYPNGDVTYLEGEDECCPEIELDLDDIVLLNDFSFTVHQGMNRITVEGGCCEMACAYINVDSLTF